MIESRIKRALWAVSILIALGFGGNSAYEYHREAQDAAFVHEWSTKSGELIKECTGLSEADYRLSRCEIRRRLMSEAIIEFGGNRNEAAEKAEQSLEIAVGTPVVLWTLFFLLRWIWTGAIRKPTRKSTPFNSNEG